MSFGIIGAMEEEIAALREAMEIMGTETIAGMEFAVGTLRGADAVVVQSGIGKVNAGVCAQILITHFGAHEIINIGVAGSLDPRINIGDILRLMEGSLAPVACLEDGALPCARAAECRTLEFWRGLDEVIQKYAGSFCLADLMRAAQPGNEYCI